MYKITVQNYTKSSPDIFLVDNIKTIRTSSGLTLNFNQNKKQITLFKDYKGEYNPYPDSITFNNVSCTDEFKKFMNYNTNALLSVQVEFIRQ